MAAETTITLDAPVVLPLYQWTLLTLTFAAADSNALKFYANGLLMATASPTGGLEYQTGGNASPWVLGRGVGGGACPNIGLGPIWIESVARSADYELVRYQAGARRY
jgi:hypothetical protein